MSAAGIAAVRESAASDAELVRAVRAGDAPAFEELYRRYHPPVLAYVRRFVRDPGRSEDVAQEAFVSALKQMRRTDSEIKFKPWIYEIARNASIDLYRRRTRAEEVSIDVEGGLAAADAGRLTGEATLDASILGKERFDNLRGALEELSEPHHRIIVMRELEGRSYREIGDRMRLTPAAVESTLFRARRRLEHEYEELDTGRRCQLVAATIGRLAEGIESQRDRRRLARHARRCSSCRRRARQLGIEPLRGSGVGARAAAWLPLPAILRRRLDLSDATGSVHGAAASLGAMGPPGVEVASGVGGKAVAVVAAVALVGGGGATLGGVGPLAVRGGVTAGQSQGTPPTARTEGLSGHRAAQPGDRSGRPGDTGRSGHGNRAPHRHGQDAPGSSLLPGRALGGVEELPHIPGIPGLGPAGPKGGGTQRPPDGWPGSAPDSLVVPDPPADSPKGGKGPEPGAALDTPSVAEPVAAAAAAAAGEGAGSSGG